MDILVLDSELAGYFLSSVRKLYENHGYTVHIVTRAPNPEAPFQFNDEEGILYYEREDLKYLELQKLYKKLQPSIVYISGWGDKLYLKLAKEIRKKNIPVICSCDNQWSASIRQILGGIIFRKKLHSCFSHIIIPGVYQYPFAWYLGFKKHQVLIGMNTADVPKFHKAYFEYKEKKHKMYPHNFLYVGRFVSIKGLEVLCEAFIQLCDEKKHDWTLTLVGTGPLKDKLPSHDRISFLPFVQPDNLPQLAENAGCFILPSSAEPWGVVIHEFASAGLPIICTNICGAATVFLRPGYNGFMHKPADSKDIKNKMLKIMNKKDSELEAMGERSYLLSHQFNPDSWAENILSVLPNNYNT